MLALKVCCAHGTLWPRLLLKFILVDMLQTLYPVQYPRYLQRPVRLTYVHLSCKWLQVNAHTKHTGTYMYGYMLVSLSLCRLNPCSVARAKLCKKASYIQPFGKQYLAAAA